MNKLETTVVLNDFRRLSELHDLATNACKLLKAMSNKWRLMILCQLSEGEKTLGELQQLLGVGQSAVSQHLAILRRERIVASRKHAQSIFYSLSGDQAIRSWRLCTMYFAAKQNPQPKFRYRRYQ